MDYEYMKVYLNQYLSFKSFNLDDEYRERVNRLRNQTFDEYDLFRLIELRAEMKLYDSIQAELSEVFKMLDEYL